MALKALGYFLSGVIAAIVGTYTNPIILQLLPTLPIPPLVTNAIIVGILVVIAHLIIHRFLKID